MVHWPGSIASLRPLSKPPMYGTTYAQRVVVFKCLLNGASLRATERITGVSINTISMLLPQAGAACKRWYDAETVDQDDAGSRRRHREEPGVGPLNRGPRGGAAIGARRQDDRAPARLADAGSRPEPWGPSGLYGTRPDAGGPSWRATISSAAATTAAPGDLAIARRSACPHRLPSLHGGMIPPYWGDGECGDPILWIGDQARFRHYRILGPLGLGSGSGASSTPTGCRRTRA